MLRAVIFDLGGTLIDYQGSSGTWVDKESRAISAFYALLVEAGLEPPQPESFIATGLRLIQEMWRLACGGGPSFAVGDFLARLSETHDLNVPEDVLAEGVRRYAVVIQSGVRLLDGAAELLGGLKARGFKLGLISNTHWPAALHEADLHRFGLDRYFEATLFSGECGLWKPQPAVFRAMLDRLGVGADEAVFVGDSPQQDIAGAQGVAIRAVWIESAMENPDGVRPDAAIRRLDELPAVLAGWGAV